MDDETYWTLSTRTVYCWLVIIYLIPFFEQWWKYMNAISTDCATSNWYSFQIISENPDKRWWLLHSRNHWSMVWNHGMFKVIKFETASDEKVENCRQNQGKWDIVLTSLKFEIQRFQCTYYIPSHMKSMPTACLVTAHTSSMGCLALPPSFLTYVARLKIKYHSCT